MSNNGHAAELLLEPQPVVIAPPRVELRLDLACGQTPREGFDGVDLLAPDAKHRVDLMRFPWPWADGSVRELHCSHFVEHLPMREVKHAGRRKDQLFAFFDECYRILEPGGDMTVVVPALKSVRAFMDPTHRRFIPQETFLYLNAAWRALNKLDHYAVDCDFVVTNVMPTTQLEETLRTPEVQAKRFRECWDVAADFVATLKKPLAGGAA